MSPTKKVMVLLVQSLKEVTKKTGVVDSELTQGYFSEHWISFPAIMKTSRGLHKVTQEQVQRTGAALVCYRGINMQASVKQLFPVPINLMRGNVFLHALHLTQAQVISGRQIELHFVT